MRRPAARPKGDVPESGRVRLRRCSKNIPPAATFSQEALFYLGEALMPQGQKAEAIKAYDRLLKQFGKSKRRADALYARGVAQEELGQHADAGASYDEFLRNFSASPLVDEVRLRKGETLVQAGDIAAAERLFGGLATTAGFNGGGRRACAAGVLPGKARAICRCRRCCMPALATDFRRRRKRPTR